MNLYSSMRIYVKVEKILKQVQDDELWNVHCARCFCGLKLLCFITDSLKDPSTSLRMTTRGIPCTPRFRGQGLLRNYGVVHHYSIPVFREFFYSI